MENYIREIKNKAADALIDLSLIIKDIMNITERHVNALPETPLLGDSDKETKRRGISLHYEFVNNFSELIHRASAPRGQLGAILSELDGLSAKCTYEELEALIPLVGALLDVQKKLYEADRVSGRFISRLDLYADPKHRGEGSDIRSQKKICREYFEFLKGYCIFVDNLNKIW